MPRILEFFGILIFMYFSKHGKPHFHAQYQNFMATITIDDGEVKGNLPNRALSMVQEWREIHKQELLNNWAQARNHGALAPIAPLN